MLKILLLWPKATTLFYLIFLVFVAATKNVAKMFSDNKRKFLLRKCFSKSLFNVSTDAGHRWYIFRVHKKNFHLNFCRNCPPVQVSSKKEHVFEKMGFIGLKKWSKKNHSPKKMIFWFSKDFIKKNIIQDIRKKISN